MMMATTMASLSGSWSTIVGSKSSLESLNWCEFAGESRLVCHYSGNSKIDGQLVPFTRLVTVSAEGGGMRALGQKASDKDASGGYAVIDAATMSNRRLAASSTLMTSSTVMPPGTA